MNIKKISQSFADWVVQKEYGTVIPHEEIERITGLSRRSHQYRSVIRSADPILSKKGKKIANIHGVGYRVLEPDDYPNQAVSLMVSGGRRISAGEHILTIAPVSDMSEDGRRVYQRVMDKTMSLHASITRGITEVQTLCNKRNPFLPGNHQSAHT